MTPSLLFGNWTFARNMTSLS